LLFRICKIHDNIGSAAQQKEANGERRNAEEKQTGYLSWPSSRDSQRSEQDCPGRAEQDQESDCSHGDAKRFRGSHLAILTYEIVAVTEPGRSRDLDPVWPCGNNT
jgi:hypothetical protein